LKPQLGAQEAADYLKIRKKTLLEWTRKGQVKGYRLSGTVRHVYRYRQSDLDACMVVTANYQDHVLESPRSSAVPIH
jgi:excisionase family DNA binding protein